MHRTHTHKKTSGVWSDHNLAGPMGAGLSGSFRFGNFVVFIVQARPIEQAIASFDETWDNEQRRINSRPEARPCASSSGSASCAAPAVPCAAALPEGVQPPPAPPCAEEIRDKTIVQHLRKAHNAWDRAKRDFVGMVLQSSEHENTKGSACRRPL